MQVFINVPYPMVDENIPRIVDLGVGCEIYLDNHVIDNLERRQVKETGEKLRSMNIPCTVHAPFMDLSPGGYDRKVRALTREILKRAAEYALALGARGLVCHPGYDRWRFAGNVQLWLDGSAETWPEILSEAGEMPVMLENVFEDEPSTLLELLRYFSGKNLWYCFDSGHFNLFSRVSLHEWLMPLRKFVREMHLHDNSGKADDHLPVGSGTFPFRELKSILGAIDNEVNYVAEVHGESYAALAVKNLKELLS